MGAFMRLIGRKAHVSARTAVYLTSSHEVAGLTGQYFYRGRSSRSKPITYDTAVAGRLWSVSESLNGVDEQIAMEAAK